MLSANWLTEIIKIAAFVAVAISFYIVFWPRIRVILGKDDSTLRSMELKAKYMGSQSEDDAAIHQGILLRHIKAAWHEDELICLFVNEGDSALNIRIEIEEDAVGTMAPCDYLKSGQTGSIRLRFPSPSLADDVLFSIRYEDEMGYGRREDYLVEAEELILCRQDGALGKVE
jgi:hypothetical protein